MALRSLLWPSATKAPANSATPPKAARGGEAPTLPLTQPTLNMETFARRLRFLVDLTSSPDGILALPREQRSVFELQWGSIQEYGLAKAPARPGSACASATFRSPTGAARRIAIVVLAWNGLELTRRCLETLRRNTTHQSFEVWVVDNGSRDGTRAYLRSLPWIRRIENDTNVGFVRGNNQALAACDPQADVVLLNNDVEIHQPDWLDQLQRTAYSSADVGVVGCRLRRPNGRMQHAGAYLPLDTFWGQQIASEEDGVGQYAQDRTVESVVFACAYLKRDVLQRVGHLDERYFAYFEDTDYCFSARELGYRTVCCGGVTLEHHENASTRINGVSHGALFQRSQALFREKWEARLRRTRYSHRLGWRSSINLPTGYGISSREMVLALDRAGVEVAYRYLYGPGTPMPLLEPEQSGIDLLNLVRQRPLEPGGVQVAYGQGDVLFRNDGGYRIGYTMLETDGVPREWVAQANRMDEIWVPSRFNLETMRDSGVTRPIHVTPLGIDPHYFHPAMKGERNPRAFTFLSVFEWGERKAPEILLRAFTDEFGVGEDVLLLLKVVNRDEKVDVRQQIAQLRLAPSGGRVVLSCNDLIPTYQLGCLYRMADCLVLASRGEGWGMPALEAMACGVPVIATAWSAMTDFVDESVGYPLAIERLVPAKAKCPYYEGFRWAEPSYEHLRALMRHVYEHPQEAAARGTRAADVARDRWTWDHSAARIADRLGTIAATR